MSEQRFDVPVFFFKFARFWRKLASGGRQMRCGGGKVALWRLHGVGPCSYRAPQKVASSVSTTSTTTTTTAATTSPSICKSMQISRCLPSVLAPFFFFVVVVLSFVSFSFFFLPGSLHRRSSIKKKNPPKKNSRNNILLIHFCLVLFTGDRR